MLLHYASANLEKMSNITNVSNIAGPHVKPSFSSVSPDDEKDDESYDGENENTGDTDTDSNTEL